MQGRRHTLHMPTVCLPALSRAQQTWSEGQKSEIIIQSQKKILDRCIFKVKRTPYRISLLVLHAVRCAQGTLKNKTRSVTMNTSARCKVRLYFGFCPLYSRGHFASLLTRGAIARLESSDLLLDGIGFRRVGLRGTPVVVLLRSLALLPIKVPQRDREALRVGREHLPARSRRGGGGSVRSTRVCTMHIPRAARGSPRRR